MQLPNNSLQAAMQPTTAAPAHNGGYPQPAPQYQPQGYPQPQGYQQPAQAPQYQPQAPFGQAAPQAPQQPQVFGQQPGTQPQAGPVLLQGEQAKQSMQQSSGSRQTFGFRLKVGEMRTVTFLDGDLDSTSGLFSCAGYANIHNVRHGAKSFESYQCLADIQQHCPLCDHHRDYKDGPVGYAGFAGFFTIIDHQGYVNDQQQPVQYVRRPLKAGKKTLQQLYTILQALASADGVHSLKGRTFQVSRSSDKSPGCGDVWIPLPQEGIRDVPQLIYQLQQAYPDRRDTFTLVQPSEILTLAQAPELAAIISRLGSGGAPASMAAPFGQQPQGYPQPQGYQQPAQAPQYQPQAPFGQAAPQAPQQPQVFGQQPAPQHNGGFPPPATQYQQPAPQPQQPVAGGNMPWGQPPQQPQQPAFGAGVVPPGDGIAL